jgi:DNA-binding XRE family transcriptional regulator
MSNLAILVPMKRKDFKSTYASQKFLLALGKNLSSLRISQKKDLATVAAALEITPKLLEKIEKGEHDCDLLLFFDLCEYYQVKATHVFP